jgi:Fe-S cluster biogenesis protein NfuA
MHETLSTKSETLGRKGLNDVPRTTSGVAPQDGAAERILKEKVQKILDEKINPAVASHGGEIVLFDVQGRTVFLQMSGGCQGCGMANFTLREGIESLLRHEIPEIEDIRDVTDHADGQNPYYAPQNDY